MQKDLSLSNITYSIQPIALISTIPRDKPIQALLHQHIQGKIQLYELVVIGERSVSLWKIRQGKVEEGYLQDSTYFLR